MKKLFYFTIFLFSITILNCTGDSVNEKTSEVKKTSKKNAFDISKADSIEYSYSSFPLPDYDGYTITITPSRLIIEIRYHSEDIIPEERPFTKSEFEEVKQTFKALQKKSQYKKSDCDGCDSEFTKFYSNDKLLFEAENIDMHLRNYTGVEKISLAYLVPDMQTLLEQAEKKYGREKDLPDEKRDEDNDH